MIMEKNKRYSDIKMEKCGTVVYIAFRYWIVVEALMADKRFSRPS